MIPIRPSYIERTFQALVRHFEEHKPIRPLGVRDAGAIEACAARPFASFGDYEKYPGDFEKAAALMHSLTQNHPYLNGNKRVALVAAFAWLKASGYSIAPDLSDADVVALALRIASGRDRSPTARTDPDAEVNDLASWFESVCEGTSEHQGPEDEALAWTIERFRGALDTLADC